MAGPNGARIGIHAALMAEAGITGPQDCFDGPTGLWQHTVGRPVDIPLNTAPRDGLFAIQQSDIKLFPIRNACQLPVQLTLELRAAVPADDIAEIVIWTDEHSFGVPAKDPALWHPTTRESADHSLPFCVAAAILDGKIDPRTFEHERFFDQDILDLIGKITIQFEPEFSAAAPGQRACRIMVRDSAGSDHKIERIWPEGDPRRLLGKNAVGAKFTILLGPLLGQQAATELLDELTGLSAPQDVKHLVDALCAVERD